MRRPTDMPALKSATLTPYLAVLARLGITATPSSAARRPGVGVQPPAAWLRLRGAWGDADWPVEAKRRLERGMIGPVTHRMQELRARAGRAILLTEHVTPPLAEELRERDVSFVDACGNAYLRDDGLYVWVTSRPRAPRANRGRRGLHAAGLKLLYVLLRRRQHARNLRDLAAEAGIALGGVARILDELEERAWIRRARQSIELVEPAAMLKRWDDGYADTLRPKLLANACRRRPGTALEDLAREVARPALRDRILIGGELGAACVTRDLLPETATLHLDGIEAIDAMRELQLVPDPRGDVFLVHAFGRVQRATDAPDAEVPLADPLLIRGELLLRPIDRLRALAETLRADHIATRWT